MSGSKVCSVCINVALGFRRQQQDEITGQQTPI